MPKLRGMGAKMKCYICEIGYCHEKALYDKFGCEDGEYCECGCELLE